jgi:hypothetical protein
MWEIFVHRDGGVLIPRLRQQASSTPAPQLHRAPAPRRAGHGRPALVGVSARGQSHATSADGGRAGDPAPERQRNADPPPHARPGEAARGASRATALYGRSVADASRTESDSSRQAIHTGDPLNGAGGCRRDGSLTGILGGIRDHDSSGLAEREARLLSCGCLLGRCTAASSERQIGSGSTSARRPQCTRPVQARSRSRLRRPDPPARVSTTNSRHKPHRPRRAPRRRSAGSAGGIGEELHDAFIAVEADLVGLLDDRPGHGYTWLWVRERPGCQGRCSIYLWQPG